MDHIKVPKPAAEQGLGTCMLGWFDEKDVKKLLGIKKNKRIPLIITLGYPRSDEIPDKKRKDIEKLRSYNSYLSSRGYC